MSSERSTLITARPPGLVDVLDRILDKVCSIDKAEQIGLNWWRYDSNLTTHAGRAEAENIELRERLNVLEMEMKKLGAPVSAARNPERNPGANSRRIPKTAVPRRAKGKPRV